MKIYGKFISRYFRVSKDNPKEIHNCLEIYQTKRGLKGVLFDCGGNNWRTKENVLSVAHFNNSDENLFRVLEYFHF